MTSSLIHYSVCLGAALVPTPPKYIETGLRVSAVFATLQNAVVLGDLLTGAPHFPVSRLGKMNVFSVTSQFLSQWLD